MTPSSTYYVYCMLFDGITYTGYTENLSKRLNQHRKGLSITTKGYIKKYGKPIAIYYREFETKMKALKYEKTFKKYSLKRKLSLFNNDHFGEVMTG